MTSEYEREGWLVERATGEWPFYRWSLGQLKLSPGAGYFSHRGISRLDGLRYRCIKAFGRPDPDRLAKCLEAIRETTEAAIEASDLDAHASWLRHEVWLPVLDDSLDGSKEPADLLAQSIEYVGAPDGFSEQELMAALGLWLVREFQESAEHDELGLAVQIGIAVAEAEFYRGVSRGMKVVSAKIASSTRKANDARHEANRKRAKEAESWWTDHAKGKLEPAEAAREIAKRFHVVEDVAKRWERTFRRKPTNPASESHNPTQ